MRLLIPLFFLLTIATTSIAQSHSTVKAIILDSLDQKPIALATVSILRLSDSSLIAYTITDKTGAFTLRNLHNEPSRLLLSHVGYQSLRININLKKDEAIDLGRLYMTVKMLNEVTIKGERVPVIIKKDTIEFDAEAFKTRPNALVEDLLKKLPGVQVDHDGNITVNGKDISKIKVDGKDFFANDPKIATRNLDADMIAKVQVYDDRENDPDHQIPDYQVKKIINLKFKKAFNKGSLSKFIAAGGTQDRYDANVFYSRFEKNMQIAVNANSNNLSGTGIFSDDSRGPGIYGGQSGVVKSTIGTLHFNDSYGKKFKLNADYQFSDEVTDNNNASQRQQFISDTTFTTNSWNLAHRKSNLQSLTAKAEWAPDTSTTVKYEPKVTYNYNSNKNSAASTTSNNFIPLINNNLSDNYGSSSSTQYQHDLNYYHKLNKKGASLAISNAISIHPENGRNFNNNDLTSYIAALQSDTLRRTAKTTNTDNAENLTVGLHYPITKKLSGNITVSGNHERNGGDLLTYNEDLKTGQYTIFLQDQSSNLIRNNWQQTANTDFTYQFTDNISLKAGLSGQALQISNHFNSYTNDLNQHLFYLLPSAELRLNKVTFSYGNEARQPAINDLQPIKIVYSPLFTFIGNPSLKPTGVHHWAVNYFDFNAQSQLFFNFSTNVTVETNTILRERTVNAEGAEVTTPINRNGRFTVNLYAFAGKEFKKQDKWQLNLTTGVNAVMGHNFFNVNKQDGYQNTQAVILTEQFTANWNNVFEIRPAYSVNYALTKYQLVDLKNSAYTTQRAVLAADLYLPQKYTWDVNYAYSYNPLVAQGFRQKSNLISISFARHIQKKDKGELRITCYDLLNQSVNSVHYASENTINDIQYQPIKRYFLLTYTYRFSNFGNFGL
jgi:hypothetical protein